MPNELLTMLGGFFSSGDSAKIGAIHNKNVEINSEIYDYQLYAPPNSENKENLPVIVFLHGIRERGVNGFVPAGAFGKILLQQLARVPALILLPQCRPGKFWSDAAMDEMVSSALAQTIREYDADERRIYLIGVSMGGYGVWHFAAEYPGKFAALVSICGGSPLRSGDRVAPIARQVGATPAWLFHGAEDSIVQVSESRNLVAALENNDGRVKYTEYAGVGHNVWLKVLTEKELMPWLLAQRLART